MLQVSCGKNAVVRNAAKHRPDFDVLQVAPMRCGRKVTMFSCLLDTLENGDELS